MENKKTEHKTFPLPDKKKAKSGIRKWVKFIWIAFFAVNLDVIFNSNPVCALMFSFRNKASKELISLL